VDRIALLFMTVPDEVRQNSGNLVSSMREDSKAIQSTLWRSVLRALRSGGFQDATSPRFVHQSVATPIICQNTRSATMRVP
jgi:hypothetical protein